MGSKVNPKELQKVVNDMATSMDKSRETMDALVKTLTEAAKPMKSIMDSVSDVADSLDDTITKYKQINSLSMRLQRMTGAELKDRESLKRILEDSVEEMKQAEKALKNDAIAAGKVHEQIEAMDKAIAEVAKTGGSTDDLHKALVAVQKAGLEAAKSIKTIDLTEPIKGVEALGDAFGKALSGLKVLDNYGFKGLIGQLETTRNKVKALRDESKKDIKENKARAIDKFGTDKLEGFRTRHGGLSTQAEKDSMIRALSGKTGASGWMDRKLGSMAMKEGGGPMSKVAGSLMQMGGGSVMGGLGSVVSRAALPVAIVTGILQVLQKGFDRNKEVYSALGGGGLVGNGAQTSKGLRDAFDGWNDALTSRGNGSGSGTGRYYGMDFEKSLDAMKEVVESGIAVQSNQGGIHKNRNIDEVIGGGRATDIYSGVMRNAAVFGKPIGMDSTEAARESMKMMKDFSLSMGEVEDLFVSIHQAVQTTGISTSKYLELINGITGQFDKFNKSLNFTVALVATLGKGAKYTGDDLQGMVKGLMGEKKDLIQSAFAYQSMGRPGREGLVEGYEQQSNRTREELRKHKGFEDIDENTLPADILSRAKENGGDQATTTLAQRYIAEQTKSGAGRRLLGKGEQEQSLGFAALDQNTGSDPKSDIVKHLALMDVAMKKSSDGVSSLLDFRRDTPEREGRVRDTLSSPMLSEISKLFGISVPDTQKYMASAMHQMASEIELAGGKGKKADEAAAGLDLSPDDRDKLSKQLAGGTKANETDAFIKLFRESGMARMGSTIGEEARKATEDAADKAQRYITGPMDYIQKALAELVENITRLLSTIISWSTYAMGGKSIEEQKARNMEDARHNDRTTDIESTKTLLKGNETFDFLHKQAATANTYANTAEAEGGMGEYVDPAYRTQVTEATKDFFTLMKLITDAKKAGRIAARNAGVEAPAAITKAGEAAGAIALDNGIVKDITTPNAKTGLPESTGKVHTITPGQISNNLSSIRLLTTEQAALALRRADAASPEGQRDQAAGAAVGRIGLPDTADQRRKDAKAKADEDALKVAEEPVGPGPVERVDVDPNPKTAAAASSVSRIPLVPAGEASRPPATPPFGYPGGDRFNLFNVDATSKTNISQFGSNQSNELVGH